MSLKKEVEKEEEALGEELSSSSTMPGVEHFVSGIRSDDLVSALEVHEESSFWTAAAARGRPRRAARDAIAAKTTKCPRTTAKNGRAASRPGPGI